MDNNSLKARIMNDMKEAMRQKEPLRLSTIRMLLAAIKQREIDDKTTLDDAATLKVINKMVKQRQDAQAQFAQAGRDELADKESKEIEILEDYLPEQISETELDNIIEKTIKETGANSMKEMGKVMAKLKPILEGRTDMRALSAKIKNLLNSKNHE